MRKKDKCRKYFNRFLAMDKNEILPLCVSLHLLTCVKCRTAVRSMTVAEDLLQQKMGENTRRTKPRTENPAEEEQNTRRSCTAADPVVQAALRRLEEAGLVYSGTPVTGQVSLGKWIAGGFLLILCLAAFPFTYPGQWAAKTFAVYFILPFYLLTGTAVAVYISVFIGSNMDFFVKKIRKGIRSGSGPGARKNRTGRTADINSKATQDS